MATPLSELTFHRGPDPQKSGKDDGKVSDEVMAMGNYLQEQYSFASSSVLSKEKVFSTSSLIPLFITGKKHNIPNLVSILWDVYCQWKLVKIWESKKNPQSLSAPKNFSFEYFLLGSPLGENMNFTSKKIQLLVNGMNEYYFNYFWPISRTSMALINDSFLSYTKYALSISQAVAAIIGKNSPLLPLHLDFWIVPRSVMVKSSDDDDNDEKNIYDEQQDDVLMNIEKRLNIGNIQFATTTIKNEKDMSSIGISQLLSRKITEILKNNKKSNRRIMTIIDRRSYYYDFTVEENKENKENKENQGMKSQDPPLIECDKKNKIRNVGEKIYFYQVDNEFGVIPKDYLQERLLYNTQQWLLPFCRIKRKNKHLYDGGTNFAWKNQVFMLSFHVNSAKDVKLYWYLNGSLMRFMPNNMLDIWPNYFFKNKKEVQQLSHKQIQKEWKLKITDNVYQQYYKELVPQ